VGKAKDLKKRVSSYFTKTFSLGEKTSLLVSQIATINVTLVESEIESLLLEANLIKRYSPKYNARLTDGKMYPVIRIAIKNDVPWVSVARKRDDPKSVYFGPYPESSAMRYVLRMLRRVFPYVSVQNHDKKPCLYNHINLCPCVSKTSTEEAKIAYKKNLKRLIQFLQGKKKALLLSLKRERDRESKNENFEAASNLQKQIDSIVYITSKNREAFEYEINPNLRSDIREEERSELIAVLEKCGVNLENLTRIECFDISNISGTHAVGSMVVFIDGDKASNWYRRFKIKKNPGKPNDFAMMQEVLERRLRRQDWKWPDLIIVDGGKGQVTAALTAMKNVEKTVPLIGLAKREEIIITSDHKEILLPRSSNALKLIMRIRDEAHRFAVTYHKKLRSKYAISKG
jgi:excinuclease ABC subunit C